MSKDGRRIKLSTGRKLVMELLHHARKVPLVPVARTMCIADLAARRERMAPRPSWTAIFIRAYGLLSREYKELRRVFIRWPRPHFYEHAFSVCSLVVERELEDESALLAAKIRAPEETPLDVIDEHLRRFKDAPLEEISDFRQTLRLGRLPGFLRRLFVWQILNCSGPRRARRFGTFLVSSYGSLGAEQYHPISPFTSLLTFGPIDPTGKVVVKIVYDHRVMDGRCVARCLRDLETILNKEIADELGGVGKAA